MRLGFETHSGAGGQKSRQEQGVNKSAQETKGTTRRMRRQPTAVAGLSFAQRNRVRFVRASAFVLMALAATSAWAQPAGGDEVPFSADRLKVEVQQVLPPAEAQHFTSHGSKRTVDSLIPLDGLIQPLLEKLPLQQIIPQLLRTEERFTIQVDNYTVKPRVGLHEVGIVVTRPLSQ